MRYFLIAAVVALFPVVNSARADDPTGILKVDPVELVQGKEIDGKESLSADHYRYRYYFASEANRAAFLKDPARYEIQMGGACARMGPLSGLGRTEYFAAHDGRVYIFASPACRQGFLSAPDKHLDPDEPAPKGDAAAAQHGRELIDLAVEAMGGAKRIDAVKTLHQSLVKDTEYQGRKVRDGVSVTLRFPDDVRHDYTWDQSVYSHVTTRDAAWYEDKSENYPLHAQQRRALRRTYLDRNLLAILKARNAPGFVAIHLGAARVSEGDKVLAVERVAIGLDGTTTTLGIDPKTGRVLSMTYRAVGGPKAMFGETERVFSDFVEIRGITYPRTAAIRFEGQPVKASPVTLSALRIDDDADADSFRRPGK